MAEPPEQMPAIAGRGHLRASHADREQVIETLKAAYVRGMLAKDELDARVGQVLSSRTYADLAALTADIPPQPAAAGLARPPARVRSLPLAKAVAGSGGCLIIAAAARWGVGILDPSPPAPSPDHGWVPLMFLIALAAVLAALGFLIFGMSTAVEQRRSRGQPPPRPGPGGHALETARHGSAGHGPAPRAPRTDQTRTDLRAHQPRQHRQHTPTRRGRAPRGARPAPGTV